MLAKNNENVIKETNPNAVHIDCYEGRMKKISWVITHAKYKHRLVYNTFIRMSIEVNWWKEGQLPLHRKFVRAILPHEILL